MASILFLFFLEIFIILVCDLFLKMVALGDMIVVLDNSYFHIFSWYACSLQCATNIGIVNHVTPRVLDLCTLAVLYMHITRYISNRPKIIDRLRYCST